MNLFSQFSDMYGILTHSWGAKVLLCFLTEFGIWILGLKHVQVMGVFVLLVFINLATKCAAISYKMLIDMGARKEALSSVDKWIAIPEAFNRKLISTKEIADPLIFKINTYIIATLVALAADYIITGGTMKNSFILNLLWLYLGSCEFLAILENLRDGGNELMGKFLDMVRNKIENKIKM